MGGTLQFIILQLCFWKHFSSVAITSYLIMVVAAITAFMDVLVDGMIVVQARKDKESGSEKIQSFTWTVQMTGAVVGSALSSYITGYYHPKWSFFVYSIFGLVVVYSGYQLNP